MPSNTTFSMFVNNLYLEEYMNQIINAVDQFFGRSERCTNIKRLFLKVDILG